MPRYESPWHLVQVHEEEPGWIDVEALCDEEGCPDPPNYEYRCAVQAAIGDGIWSADFDELQPGRYMVKHRVWQDYGGEWDEALDIREVPYVIQEGVEAQGQDG